MLPESEFTEIAAGLMTRAPRRVVEAIVEHRRIAADALRRIDAEGTVVRTLKGDVIAHPAIRIHAEAVKSETALLKDWMKKV